MSERYETPAHGDSDWHIPLNENFEALDRDIEIRDLDDNRADYEPKDGAKFVATDTYDVYFGNGSSWERIGRYGDPPSADVKRESVLEPFDADSLDYYVGDVDSFDVVSGAREGSEYMLENDVGDTNGSTIDDEIFTDDIETGRGYTYSTYVAARWSTADRLQVGPMLLANWDEDGAVLDGYHVRLNFAQNEGEIRRWEGGGGSNHSFDLRDSLEPDRWYRIELDAGSGSRATEVRVYHESDRIGRYNFTEDEPEPLTGQGFGLRVRARTADSASVYFDTVTKQPIDTANGQGVINSPDIERIFVRDTDPASDFSVDEYDLWIDTSE